MNYCYSNDLWLGFDTIIRHFNVERNMMKKIMYIISEKKNIEFEYAEQLSNLYSFYQKNKISNEEEYSLHKAFNVFFEEIKKESELHLKNVLSIENNIIKETNKLINEQIKKSHEIVEKIHTYPKNFSEIVKTLESYHMQFQSAVKMAENKILSNQKLIDENKQKNKKDYTLPKKDDEKQKGLIKFAKDLEKKYTIFIKEANGERINFINTTTDILNAYQEMDTAFIQHVKDKLKLYNDSYSIIYKQKLSAYENQNKVINEISVENDISKFILKNETNMLPPKEFKFIPYQSELHQKLNMKNNMKLDVYKNVSRVLNQNFKDENKESISDQTVLKELNQIEQFILDIWEEKNTDSSMVVSLIEKSKLNRMHFLNSMNKYRIEGLFTISQKTFDALTPILNLILSKADEKEEYDTIKLCMIMSQTFNSINDKNNLLQNGIISNSIFQNEKTWNNLITYSIKTEVSNEQGYINYINEKEEERQRRVCSSAFGNLMTYWFNMKTFNYPIDKSKVIIEAFAKKYNINTNDIYGINESKKEILEEFKNITHDDVIEKTEAFYDKKK